MRRELINWQLKTHTSTRKQDKVSIQALKIKGWQVDLREGIEKRQRKRGRREKGRVREKKKERMRGRKQGSQSGRKGWREEGRLP